MKSRQEKASAVTTLKIGKPRDAIARERGILYYRCWCANRFRGKGLPIKILCFLLTISCGFEA